MADNPRRVLPPADTGPPDMEPNRHHRAGPFGVVDIGSTKIACLIGRTNPTARCGCSALVGRRAAV